MFHACVQRFDGMDEKILGGELFSLRDLGVGTSPTARAPSTLFLPIDLDPRQDWSVVE
jgi:hypothetical protein